jgi:hypothetical protein
MYKKFTGIYLNAFLETHRHTQYRYRNFHNPVWEKMFIVFLSAPGARFGRAWYWYAEQAGCGRHAAGPALDWRLAPLSRSGFVRGPPGGLPALRQHLRPARRHTVQDQPLYQRPLPAHHRQRFNQLVPEVSKNIFYRLPGMKRFIPVQ